LRAKSKRSSGGGRRRRRWGRGEQRSRQEPQDDDPGDQPDHHGETRRGGGVVEPCDRGEADDGQHDEDEVCSQRVPTGQDPDRRADRQHHDDRAGDQQRLVAVADQVDQPDGEPSRRLVADRARDRLDGRVRRTQRPDGRLAGHEAGDPGQHPGEREGTGRAVSLHLTIVTHGDNAGGDDSLTSGPPAVGHDRGVDLRIGIGTDVHRLVQGRPMRIAGLDWPDEPTGPEGHSDGDVVLHAVCDALLSAAGLGDLGSNFGTDAPEWAGADSGDLLAETVRRVADAGWTIGNVAVQLVGNRPRLGTRRAEAEAAIAGRHGITVSISATTTDGLGLTGRGEGLAAIATALVTRAGHLG
jgi:2-C-methyl-D-erythritol 2,4-cyclodiphosphate synthase